MPEAAAELDGFWLYAARESASIDIANRLIDNLRRGFAQHKKQGALLGFGLTSYGAQAAKHFYVFLLS